MGLLEKLQKDEIDDNSLESEMAHDILETLESTKELISPRRVILLLPQFFPCFLYLYSP